MSSSNVSEMLSKYDASSLYTDELESQKQNDSNASQEELEMSTEMLPMMEKSNAIFD